MNITIELKKDYNCQVHEIAQIIWQNMILAYELGYLYQTKIIGEIIIKPKEINIDYISQLVCKYFNVSMELMQSKTHKGPIVKARHVATYLSKQIIKAPYEHIGFKIGGMSRVNAMKCCKTIQNLRDTDNYFNKQIEDIEKLLKW